MATLVSRTLAQTTSEPAPIASTSEASAEPAPEFRVGYDPEHGAYIGTSDRRWELNPYGMVQLQNSTLWKDGRLDQTGFGLRAAKLIMHGHVLSTTLTYHLQINAGDGKVAAEDVYLRWEPVSVFSVQLGQTEVPFNRQHITLEAYQQFVERSSIDARFNLQRDIGGLFDLNDPSHVLEWTNGIWNGSRQDSPNDDRSYLLTSRLSWNPWGPIAFREADLDDSAEPKLSLAAALGYNPKRVIADATQAASTTEIRRILQGVFETTLRYRGLSLTSETHVRRQQLATSARSLDYGQLAQLGLFVVPRHFELVGRLGLVGGDRASSDVVRELAGGMNYYLLGHRLKLQADYTNLRLASRVVENRVRAQLEFFL